MCVHTYIYTYIYTRVQMQLGEGIRVSELLTFRVASECYAFSHVPLRRYLGGNSKFNQLAI